MEDDVFFARQERYSRKMGKAPFKRVCCLGDVGTSSLRPECESGEARRGQSNMQCNLTSRENAGEGMGGRGL